MNRQIKGIIFDKDGTLFDFQSTWGNWAEGFITTLARGDAALVENLCEVLAYDRNNRTFMPDSLVVAESMDVIVDTIMDVVPNQERDSLVAFAVESARDAPQVPVVPLHPLLSALKARGLALGVATNDNAVPARAHLEGAGVSSMFTFVAGCDSGFGAKPETGMLSAFCDATGLGAASVAMVGDSTHDLRAGRAAGMAVIGVTTGTAPAAVLAPYADVVLPDIGHIPEWLDG